MLPLKHAQFLFDYKVHYDSIAELTEDKKGEYFYEDLKQRFVSGDTSLTAFDVLALMIGETSQDHYYPYELLPIEREIMDLANKGEYANAITKSDSILAAHPLNLTALIHKAFLEDKLGNMSSKNSKFKFVIYLDVILATGDGTLEAPIMVLGPADGQLLIRYVFGASIGNMGSGSDENGNFLDIIEIIKEGEAPTPMHFNIEHAVRRMFKEDVMKDFEKAYQKDQKQAEKEAKKEKKKSKKKKKKTAKAKFL